LDIFAHNTIKTYKVNDILVAADEPRRKHAHPIVYMFLVLPFGIGGGYVSVGLAYLFRNGGISIESIAVLSAAGIIVNVAKFLWAPLVDAFLTLKKWYVLSCLVTSFGLLTMGFFPVMQSSIVPLVLIIIMSNVASSFLGTAISGIAAHDIREEVKGRISGYYNAGNLGGAGVGGGIGLWLAQNTNHLWMPTAALAILSMLCCFGLFYVHEPLAIIRDSKLSKTMSNLLKDIWNTLKVRTGVLAMVLCFLPLGTGAAQNLWAAIAGNWSASAGTVEFVTGIMSGLITAAGCLLGGWICDRSDRKNAYVIFGLLLALSAVAMAYTPHTQLMYILWTSIYAFVLGLCYAAFSAFVFEAIGKGAAGTKYTIFASLSNAPIAIMTLIDGWAYTHYDKTGKGPEGMLDIEAIMGILGIIIFLILVKVLKKKAASVSA
jgi:MFS transporter, PAT family, beta-lactamase induction signal transducer AmpG